MNLANLWLQSCSGLVALIVTSVQREPSSIKFPLRHSALGVVIVVFLTIHCIGFNTSTAIGLALIIMAIWLAVVNMQGKAQGTIEPQLCFQPSQSPRVVSKSIRHNGWVKFACNVTSKELIAYFKVNGNPVRVAWTEASSGPTDTYNAILLMPSEAKMETLVVKGPYSMPISTYINGPGQLNIYATDSGFAEAYSCFRWRQRVLNPTTSITSLTWFSADLDYLALMQKHFQQVSCSGSIRAIYFEDPSAYEGDEVEAEERIEEAKRVIGTVGLAGSDFDARVASLRMLLRENLTHTGQQYSRCPINQLWCYPLTEIH